MAPYTPKINHHVTYLKSGTAKPRPATVTAVISATVVDLRVGRHGEVYLAVFKESADNQTGVWRKSNAF